MTDFLNREEAVILVVDVQEVVVRARGLGVDASPALVAGADDNIRLALHGGREGFDKRLWTGEGRVDELRLRCGGGGSGLVEDELTRGGRLHPVRLAWFNC